MKILSIEGRPVIRVSSSMVIGTAWYYTSKDAYRIMIDGSDNMAAHLSNGVTKEVSIHFEGHDLFS